MSSLVPNTVNVVSLLAKSSISSLQIWSLHGLLLTIEAAGLSYVSQVQVLVCLQTFISMFLFEVRISCNSCKFFTIFMSSLLQ